MAFFIHRNPLQSANLGSNPIDSDIFFKEIYVKGEKYTDDNGNEKERNHNHKANFAIDLVEVLQDPNFKDKATNFNIPTYIKEGFDFLIKETDG